MRVWQLISAVAVATSLVACGGGGGGASGTDSTVLSIKGVAATGAAISQGTVSAACASGTGSTATAIDGSYTITIPTGEGPCLLKATDPITKTSYYSAVEKAESVANISPLTHLVVANALGEAPETAFQSFSGTRLAKITTSSLATAIENVQAASTVLGASADVSGVDVMKAPLVAANGDEAGNALDQKIDALVAALSAADKRISDLEEQLRNAATNNDAKTKLQLVIGDATATLNDCPYARNGDVWNIDFLGRSPRIVSVDFEAMTATSKLDGSVMPITVKKDALNNSVKCAFNVLDTDSRNVEFRVTKSGTAVWSKSNNFGLSMPVQTSYKLTSDALRGEYAVAAFLTNKQSSQRDAAPFRMTVDGNGNMSFYMCDLSKLIPDCTSKVETDGASNLACTELSNGSMTCTSPQGADLSIIKYVAGGQASLFMSIANLPSGNNSYKGLFILTKSSSTSIPKVGQTIAAGSSWYTGVDPASSTIVSGATYAQTVESVDINAGSFVTSTAGSTTTMTRYVNTPSVGFMFSRNNSAQGVGMGSDAGGWRVAFSKPIANDAYDGWYAYAKRP